MGGHRTGSCCTLRRLTSAFAFLLVSASFFLYPVWDAAWGQFGRFGRLGGATPDGSKAYLPTSEQAAEQLLGAQRVLEQGRYAEAIDVLQEAIERYEDKVVPVGRGIHVSVRDYCHWIISRLGPEGLAVYRRRVDVRAGELFERARRTGDVARLKELVERYYCSSVGDDAINLLGDYALAEGRFDEAIAWWEQLLPEELVVGATVRAKDTEASEGWRLHYPDPDVDLAGVAAKRVVALAFAGRLKQAYAAYRLVRQFYSGSRVVVAGREEDLVHFLGKTLEAAPRRLVAGDAAWPTFGHDPHRTGRAPQSVDIGSVQWHVALPEVSRAPRFLVQRSMVSAAGLRDASPYHPIVTHGYVIVCNNSSVLAYRLQDGPGEADEPAWKYELAGDDMPTWRRSPIMGAMRAPEFTLTASGSYVYAQLGSTGIAPLRRQGQALDSVLVCLDIKQEGKLVWQRRVDDLDTVFEGAPIVVGDRLYVASRTGGSMLQSMVRCYDARTGDLIWKKLVCETPQSGRYYEQLNTSSGLLTAGGGLVFYSTNLGAVAALDAQTGAIRWIWTYQRQIDSYYGRRATGSRLNPAVYWNGRLFVAPADSSLITSLNAATGAVEWQTTMEALGGTGTPQLLGVADDKLIVCGQQVMALDAATGRKEWQAPSSGGRITPMGRGVIAGNVVYIPEATQILVLDVRTGLPERPAVELLNQHHQRPGNLVVADGYLVVAGDKLAVLCEYGVLIERYRDLLTRHPDSAVLRLRLARALEATGQEDEAIEQYRLALRQAEPGEQVEGRELTAVCRDRLYRLLVGRSERMAGQEKFEEALAALREAARVAPSPALELETRLSLAELLDRAGDPAGALATYQELLGREDLRTLAMDVAENRFVRADLVIADRVGKLLGKHGRGLYEPYERELSEARQAAVEAGDTRQLQNLLARYPNSAQRDRLLLDLGRILVQKGRWSEAVDPLRSVAQGAADPDLKREALLYLVQAFERMRLWRMAADVLNELAARFGSSPLPEGFGEGEVRDFVAERLGSEQYRWALRQEAGLTPPLEVKLVRVVGQGAKVIVPEGDRPAGVAPIYLVAAEGKLLCADAGSGSKMWAAELDGDVVWCGFVAENLIVADQSRLSAFAALSGELSWRYTFSEEDEEEGAPAAQRYTHDEGAGPVVVPPRDPRIAWLSRGRRDRRLVVIPGPAGRVYVRRPSGELLALTAGEGRELWRFRPTTGALDPAIGVGPRYVIARNGETQRVLIIDGEGRVRWDLKLGGADWIRPPVWLDSTRVCVIAGPRTAQLIDAETGQVIWQHQVEGPAERALEPIIGPEQALCFLAGAELVRVDPATGHVLWQTALAPQPLENAAGVCLADSYRVYYVTNNGVLGALDLTSGERLWQHVLTGVYALGAWRLALSGPYLVAYPAARPRSQPWAPIVVLRRDDGRLVQRLVTEPAGERASLAVLDDMALFISGTDVRAIVSSSRWLTSSADTR